MHMASTVFSVGSVTYAIKARKLLRRIGIDAVTVKLDITRAKRGCTHGIEFPSEALLRVVMELKRNGIPYERYPYV